MKSMYPTNKKKKQFKFSWNKIININIFIRA